MTEKYDQSERRDQYYDPENDRRLVELMVLLAERKNEDSSKTLVPQQADELDLAIRGYDLILGNNSADAVYQEVRTRVPAFSQIEKLLRESSATNTYQALLDDIVVKLQSGAVSNDQKRRMHYIIVALVDQLVKNDEVFQARLTAFYSNGCPPTSKLRFMIEVLRNIGYDMSMIESKLISAQ